MQSLNIAVFSSFKFQFNYAMNNWLLLNPVKTVIIYYIPGFVKDLLEAVNQANIQSGFRNFGINPTNTKMITDEDFHAPL